MELVLNDLVFEYKISHYSQLTEIIDEFISLILQLQKNRKEIRLIYDKEINGIEFMTGYNFQKLYNDNNISKNKKTLLLRLFTKVKKINTSIENKFVIKSIDSNICNWAYFNNKILISFLTNDVFRKPYLEGQLSDKQYENVRIANLGVIGHIKIHELILDIRVYEANPKHKLGQNWGSPMDLDDEVSQKVLDDAIIYGEDDKCLVNLYNNKYYVFRRHIHNRYHGYINDKIPEHIKNKLTRIKQI